MGEFGGVVGEGGEGGFGWGGVWASDPGRSGECLGGGSWQLDRAPSSPQDQQLEVSNLGEVTK